jgi:hypothetical protein
VEKFLSRKLMLTVFAVTLVAGTSLGGLDLSDESLSAIVTMVLSMVGAQGVIDTAEVIKSGRKVAEVVEEVKEASEDE